MSFSQSKKTSCNLRCHHLVSMYGLSGFNSRLGSVETGQYRKEIMLQCKHRHPDALTCACFGIVWLKMEAVIYSISQAII